MAGNIPKFKKFGSYVAIPQLLIIAQKKGENYER